MVHDFLNKFFLLATLQKVSAKPETRFITFLYLHKVGP